MKDSGWIFALIYIVLSNQVLCLQTDNKILKNEKPQRRNSKKMDVFWDSKRTQNRMNKLIDFSKQETQKNGTIGDSGELKTKIINGQEAQLGEFPWMVALHHSGRFICSAFLVSPSIVITAAHCVEYEDDVEPAESFYGIVGNVNRMMREKRLEFSEIRAHPDFGQYRSEADIAFMRTTEPVEFTDWIKPVCLPRQGRDFELEYVQAMGWGITSNDAEDAPDELMSTELVVQPRSVCQLAFVFMFMTITQRHICASANTQTGACYGDSGGPLVREDIYTGRPMAVGIASFVTFLGCGRPMIPGVYTATSSFSDWIKKEVGPQSGICFV